MYLASAANFAMNNAVTKHWYHWLWPTQPHSVSIQVCLEIRLKIS